ncbi:uncharacterized protein BJ171DRAFT_586010 [Polychytrium aggregatum]|uniref:uncharacterized protein n=1 Tax=Polychytrium aggregatum TaxID=110093 RepID=UPI0022FEC975|nr:uncharacterized protein BJ171DRAFT_586010 [Polychytrium aggregatum]KAI9197223.1 hypothetical protein BJ171DRAFT_586010 [Polychytrium aggregatum]
MTTVIPINPNAPEYYIIVTSQYNVPACIGPSDLNNNPVSKLRQKVDVTNRCKCSNIDNSGVTCLYSARSPSDNTLHQYTCLNDTSCRNSCIMSATYILDNNNPCNIQGYRLLNTTNPLDPSVLDRSFITSSFAYSAQSLGGSCDNIVSVVWVPVYLKCTSIGNGLYVISQRPTPNSTVSTYACSDPGCNTCVPGYGLTLDQSCTPSPSGPPWNITTSTNGPVLSDSSITIPTAFPNQTAPSSSGPVASPSATAQTTPVPTVDTNSNSIIVAVVCSIIGAITGVAAAFFWLRYKQGKKTPALEAGSAQPPTHRPTHHDLLDPGQGRDRSSGTLVVSDTSSPQPESPSSSSPRGSYVPGMALEQASQPRLAFPPRYSTTEVPRALPSTQRNSLASFADNVKVALRRSYASATTTSELPSYNELYSQQPESSAAAHHEVPATDISPVSVQVAVSEMAPDSAVVHAEYDATPVEAIQVTSASSVSAAADSDIKLPIRAGPEQPYGDEKAALATATAADRSIDPIELYGIPGLLDIVDSPTVLDQKLAGEESTSILFPVYRYGTEKSLAKSLTESLSLKQKSSIKSTKSTNTRYA